MGFQNMLLTELLGFLKWLMRTARQQISIYGPEIMINELD